MRDNLLKNLLFYNTSTGCDTPITAQFNVLQRLEMTSTTTAISWNEPEIDTSVNNFVEDLPSKLKRFDIPSTQHWPRSGPRKDVTLVPSLPDTFPATDDVS